MATTRGENYALQLSTLSDLEVAHTSKIREHDQILDETELGAISHVSLSASDPEIKLPELPLPPTDQGQDAWLVLVAAIFVEAMTWGLPFTFGIFQEYYSSPPEFEDRQSSITIVGTVAFGVLYLGSPLTCLGLRQWPQHRRLSTVAGVVMVAVSLAAASFATRVWHLILTQGAMYAVGGSLLYYPTLLFIDEWFVRRKGLAYGIAWSATGLSGLVFPFVVSRLLYQYSIGTTFRILAVAFLSIMLPVLFFLKPRMPVSGSLTSSPQAILDVRFVTKPPFLPCQIGVVLQSLGYFMPGLFLPTYARHMGHNSTAATATVVLLNSGTFVGSVLMGFLTDRLHVTCTTLLVSIGATLSVLLLWGLTSSPVLLCVFAFSYGITAGSCSSTWPGMVQKAKRDNSGVDTGLAYGILGAGRGVGSVLSGPLSNALLHCPPLSHTFSHGYGSKYGPMILFVGISNAAGSIVFIAHRLGWW